MKKKFVRLLKRLKPEPENIRLALALLACCLLISVCVIVGKSQEAKEVTKQLQFETPGRHYSELTPATHSTTTQTSQPATRPSTQSSQTS